jgi:hypothetical protein
MISVTSLHSIRREVVMELIESDVQSFIVKLWLEPSEGNQLRLSHGYVTHVASGERRYFKDVGGVTEFVVECLEQAGVRPGLRRGAMLWLKRRFGRGRRPK